MFVTVTGLRPGVTWRDDRAGVGLLGTGALLAVAVAAVGLTGSRTDEDAAPRSPSPSTGTPRVPSTEPSPGKRILMPNLRSTAATDLQLEQHGSLRRLRFAAWLANLGPGPLLLEPVDTSGCPPGQLAAEQLLHVDTTGDGVFQRSRDPVAERRPAGCMLDHVDHDHWHFDAMARYSLRSLSGDVIAARRKVSFCLRDNRRVPGAPVMVRREHFGECSRRDVQGISPGWVDVYTADLTGQGMRLPDGLTGSFCLELAADPLGRLAETSESDNAVVLAVQITDVTVHRLPPRICTGAAAPALLSPA
jgi:Lysyl oxidase